MSAMPKYLIYLFIQKCKYTILLAQKYKKYLVSCIKITTFAPHYAKAGVI